MQSHGFLEELGIFYWRSQLWQAPQFEMPLGLVRVRVNFLDDLVNFLVTNHLGNNRLSDVLGRQQAFRWQAAVLCST